jgi:pyrimidine operon attenuation protein/uracil phosphoribosyltransferase
MARAKNLLKNDRFQLTLDRLCHSLIEEYGDFKDTCLIGIQQRGTYFADRIHKRLTEWHPRTKIDYGKLDITYFRDDFRTREEPLNASETEINFEIEGRNVVLIDDVLYTGRTIHAAMSALQQWGRPASIALMVLVDRRFNRHFPIASNFVGITVDAVNEDYVKVEWADIHGQDQILFYHTERPKG